MKVSIHPTPPNLLSASKEAVLESQAQALRENVGSLEEPVAVWKQRRSDETQREGGRGLLGWSFLDPVASCLSRGALRSSLPHTPTSPGLCRLLFVKSGWGPIHRDHLSGVSSSPHLLAIYSSSFLSPLISDVEAPIFVKSRFWRK